MYFICYQVYIFVLTFVFLLVIIIILFVILFLLDKQRVPEWDYHGCEGAPAVHFPSCCLCYPFSRGQVCFKKKNKKKGRDGEGKRDKEGKCDMGEKGKGGNERKEKKAESVIRMMKRTK
jgi:hypothetical protein